MRDDITGRFLRSPLTRRITSHGYVQISVPDHPRADSGWIYEHHAVAETALGRLLPDGAEVHHVDEDPANNNGSNLVICESHAYHYLLHLRRRAYLATGDAHSRKCGYCRKWDSPDNLSLGKPSRGHATGNAWHKACAAAYVYKRTHAIPA